MLIRSSPGLTALHAGETASHSPWLSPCNFTTNGHQIPGNVTVPNADLIGHLAEDALVAVRCRRDPRTKRYVTNQFTIDLEDEPDQRRTSSNPLLQFSRMHAATDIPVVG